MHHVKDGENGQGCPSTDSNAIHRSAFPSDLLVGSTKSGGEQAQKQRHNVPTGLIKPEQLGSEKALQRPAPRTQDSTGGESAGGESTGNPPWVASDIGVCFQDLVQPLPSDAHGLAAPFALLPVQPRPQRGQQVIICRRLLHCSV